MGRVVFGIVALTVLASCAGGGAGTLPPPPTTSSTSDTQCKLAVMSRANTADVEVLGSRPTDNGVRVRIGVGPDQTPWRCTSFNDGRVGDVAPIRHRAHNKQHHSANADSAFHVPSIDEESCLTSVMAQANTADVEVLGSRPTDNGVRVRIGVGPDRTPWRCTSFSDGRTGDIAPIRHRGT